MEKINTSIELGQREKEILKEEVKKVLGTKDYSGETSAEIVTNSFIEELLHNCRERSINQVAITKDAVLEVVKGLRDWQKEEVIRMTNKN